MEVGRDVLVITDQTDADWWEGHLEADPAKAVRPPLQHIQLTPGV